MKNTSQSLLRIHSLISYDRGAKIRWLLAEMGIPVENRWIDRDKKENESPEFLRLNPMGRVPVLEIDDRSIFESGAICAYLADLHLDRGMAPALNAPERQAYQQWMYFAASTLDVIQTRIMIIEDIPAGEVRTAKEATLLADLDDSMQALNVTLSKRDFLVGDRFTTADICVSYHLYWCALWPELEAVMVKYPKVMNYLERMKKMPSAVKSEVFTYPA